MRFFGARTAPSQVVALGRARDGTPDPIRARVVLRLDGSEARKGQPAAAGGGAPFLDPATGARRLLLGSIFSDRMLVCNALPSQAEALG